MKRTSPAVALLLALAVLATACGSGRSSTPDDSPGTTAAVQTGGVPQFGDLPSPCGPGEPSGTPDAAVDATSVTIGYGDDAGYQGSPGLNHEAGDAVKALIGWCNQQGGINGRQVKGVYYDAKITEAGNVMAEACQQTFFMVGQFFALPGAAEQKRIGCGLPTVPGVIPAADLSNAPLMVAPYPSNILQFNVAGAAQLAQQFPEQVTRTGIIVSDFPASIDNMEKFRGSVTTVGWKFLDCIQTTPVSGVADFRPYVQYMKDCGAEVVWAGTVATGLQNLLDAADQLDFHPIWITPETTYSEQQAQWNRSGHADNLYVSNSFTPLEHAPEGSANAAYIDVVTGAGGDVSFPGQVSASAFLLWATAAKACGNDLTRACVMSELEKIDSWTAGGLSSEQRPASNDVGTCAVLLKEQGTEWVQVSPEQPGQFACDPAWRVTVDPPVTSVASLKLDDHGVAQKNAGG